MSMEVMIIPALFDLSCLLSSLMEEHKRATIQEKLAKHVLTEEEGADLDAEIEELSRRGCRINRSSSPARSDSDVVIHTERGYDIGLRRNEKGAYDVLAHWKTRPGRAQVGKAQAEIESQIRQRYAHEKVKRELAKKGFIVSSEEVGPDRTIKLVARRW